jgi:hypothetical protein
MLLFTDGCQQVTTPAHGTVFASDASSPHKRFIRLGALTDHSGSAQAVPPIQPAHLNPIIDLCVTHGCEIGIFAVESKAEDSLLRLHIDAPATQLVRPDVSNLSVFEQRKVAIRYNAELQRWLQDEARRKAGAVAQANIFKLQLPAFLLAPRIQTHSDVANALIRLDRYMLEPPADPNFVVMPMLLIGSDLIDTRSGQIYPLASRPVTAWVSREAVQARRLPGLAPVMFEAVPPAVGWLVNKSQSALAEQESSKR